MARPLLLPFPHPLPPPPPAFSLSPSLASPFCPTASHYQSLHVSHSVPSASFLIFHRPSAPFASPPRGRATFLAFVGRGVCTLGRGTIRRRTTRPRWRNPRGTAGNSVRVPALVTNASFAFCLLPPPRCELRRGGTGTFPRVNTYRASCKLPIKVSERTG